MAVNIGKFKSPLVYNYKYDQLNRLVNVNAYNSNNENWSSLTATNDYREVLSYDANGNILGYQRNGAGASQNLNNYSYTYTANTNRLARIINSVNASNATYGYDAIGNVTKDDKQNVAVNNWNLYGKLQSVQKTDGTNITYMYDAAGNRISKTVGNVTEWYVRDASGNIMSIYTAGDNNINSGHLTLSEVHKYGGGRLGTYKPNTDLTLIQNNTITLPDGTIGYTYNFTRGSTEYELTDARSNVLAMVSDKKQQHTSDNITIDYYLPDVITAQEYSSFGAISTSFNSINLKQAFNGQRRSAEIGQTAQTALFGEYNGDVGRRWNPDPKPNVGLSIYSVFANNAIWHSDILLDTPTVKEAALMSKLVYGDKLSKEDQSAFDRSGWTLSSKVTGVEYSKKSGFKSALYERTINGKAEYTYAFAGTEDIGRDGVADIKQIVGASKQYDQAIVNTREIVRQLGNEELTFTGHSLGGGLANTVALYTGKASLTFNPAWVSTITAIKYGLMFKRQTGISNYVVIGEILSLVQNASNNPSGPSLLQHVGKDYFLLAKLPLIPIYGSLMSHSIDKVLEEIKDVPRYNKVKGNGGASGSWSTGGATGTWSTGATGNW